MIKNNQSSTSSLSRSPNDLLHEQNIIKEESQYEHSVPENYHRSSYEYLSSGLGGSGLAPNNQYPTKYLPSASYSPTFYRSTQQQQQQPPPQQQLSSSSLSAYVPQHNNLNTNLNRNSLNPATAITTTTSDDSGNESSLNYHQPNHSSHFVVVAIDFGTTFSGYAFAFTRDIDSILMMRKVDGNDRGTFAFFFFFIVLFFICEQV